MSFSPTIRKKLVLDFFTKKITEIRNLSHINVFHITVLERQEMVSRSLKRFDTKDDWGVIKTVEG